MNGLRAQHFDASRQAASPTSDSSVPRGVRAGVACPKSHLDGPSLPEPALKLDVEAEDRQDAELYLRVRLMRLRIPVVAGHVFPVVDILDLDVEREVRASPQECPICPEIEPVIIREACCIHPREIVDPAVLVARGVDE